jgi:hypothetical protein
VSEAVLVGRGRALTTVALALAALTAAVLVTVVLLGLEYDFDDGILKPFEPARAPIILLAAAFAASVILLAARPWVRWIVGCAFALGSAWVLFKAELGNQHLAAAMALAAGWGVAALLLTVPRSVGLYLSRRAGSVERLLGPIDGEAAAWRWLAAAAAWEQAGIFSMRERHQLGAHLGAWVTSQGVSEELRTAIAEFSPSARESRLRTVVGTLTRRKAAADEEEQAAPSS